MKLTNREWRIPNASAWRSFQWNEKLNRMITWVIISSWLPIGKKPWIQLLRFKLSFFWPWSVAFFHAAWWYMKNSKPLLAMALSSVAWCTKRSKCCLAYSWKQRPLASSKLLVKSCEMNVFLAGLNKLYQHLIWVWTYCYPWLVIKLIAVKKSVSLIWKQLSNHHSSITCWDLRPAPQGGHLLGNMNPQWRSSMEVINEVYDSLIEEKNTCMNGKWSLTFSNHFPIEDAMGYPIFRHLLWPVRPVLQARFFGAFFRRLLMILMDIMRIKKSSCLGWRSINGKNFGDIYNINADQWPNIEKIAPSLGDVGKIQINQSIYSQSVRCIDYKL